MDAEPRRIEFLFETQHPAWWWRERVNPITNMSRAPREFFIGVGESGSGELLNHSLRYESLVAWAYIGSSCQGGNIIVNLLTGSMRPNDLLTNCLSGMSDRFIAPARMRVTWCWRNRPTEEIHCKPVSDLHGLSQIVVASRKCIARNLGSAPPLGLGFWNSALSGRRTPTRRRAGIHHTGVAADAGRPRAARSVRKWLLQRITTAWLSPAAIRFDLSLNAGADWRLIDALSRATQCPFAIGPPTRYAGWETTAIPDLRLQRAEPTGWHTGVRAAWSINQVRLDNSSNAARHDCLFTR
jgi:hypothetical protein